MQLEDPTTRAPSLWPPIGARGGPGVDTELSRVRGFC